MARVGLVLGGGGAVGQGYHRGVLAALEDVAGFDARSVDVIVGTSSGATVAGLVRAGSSRPLWIAAVGLDDGERVMFGRPGDPVTDVPTAVAASCALPARE